MHRYSRSRLMFCIVAVFKEVIVSSIGELVCIM